MSDAGVRTAALLPFILLVRLCWRRAGALVALLLHRPMCLLGGFLDPFLCGLFQPLLLLGCFLGLLSFDPFQPLFLLGCLLGLLLRDFVLRLSLLLGDRFEPLLLLGRLSF